MGNSYIKLTYGGTDYTVYCKGVKFGWTNNLVSKPYANGTIVSEVQTQTWENPIYTLSGVELVERSGALTYAKLMEMAKNKYDGSNGILLTVAYGYSTTKILPSSTGSTTGIPVVVKSFSPAITLDRTYDGTDTVFSMTGFDLVLQETA